MAESSLLRIIHEDAFVGTPGQQDFVSGPELFSNLKQHEHGLKHAHDPACRQHIDEMLPPVARDESLSYLRTFKHNLNVELIWRIKDRFDASDPPLYEKLNAIYGSLTKCEPEKNPDFMEEVKDLLGDRYQTLVDDVKIGAIASEVSFLFNNDWLLSQNITETNKLLLRHIALDCLTHPSQSLLHDEEIRKVFEKIVKKHGAVPDN